MERRGFVGSMMAAAAIATVPILSGAQVLDSDYQMFKRWCDGENEDKNPSGIFKHVVLPTDNDAYFSDIIKFWKNAKRYLEEKLSEKLPAADRIKYVENLKDVNKILRIARKDYITFTKA